MGNKTSDPVPHYHWDLSGQLGANPPGPLRGSPTTNVFTIGNSQINNYLEGVDRTGHLERATLTGHLGNPVTQVAGVDAARFPISGYSTRLIPEREAQRPEFLIAQIRPSHLRRGESTSDNSTMSATIRGYGGVGDEAGHILGNQFGGSMRYYNLYPQNASINKGFWRSMENRISSWLSSGISNANIEYQVRLIYDNYDEPMRPTCIHYLAKFKVGNRLATTEEVNRECNLMEPILLDSLPNPPSTMRFQTKGDNYLIR